MHTEYNQKTSWEVTTLEDQEEEGERTLSWILLDCED